MESPRSVCSDSPPADSSRRRSRWCAHAQIRIYPDSAHGFLFQYPSEVAADVHAFLGGVAQ
jgi:hypothetical protein